MTHITSIGQVMIALLVVSGMAAPAVAVSDIDSIASPSTTTDPVAAAMDAPDNSTQENTTVNVTAGQQLSTVIDVSSDEVQTDVENTAFEVSVENGDEEAQAEAIAERADDLRERAEDIREEYEEATKAYEAGEISKSEYAQRLATLNARSSNLLDSYEQLQQRSENVSALELRAAGMNQSELEGTVENLSSVNGAGPEALLKQYTGEAQGEIELETEDGLSIEIQSEDGEQSRELERSRDDDNSITVNQTSALQTARTALSTPENGSWVLSGSTVKQGEGAYEFTFVLQGTTTQTGEAEISVDGSSGDIFKLEEEIQTGDDDEDEAEREDDADEDEQEGEDEAAETDDEENPELAMFVAEGTPGPNETVTLRVLSDGTTAENVTVYLNDQMAGTTDADGTVTVTLPESGEAELKAQHGEAEGELEFEFEEDEEEDETFQKMAVDATLTDETVTVTVNYDDSGVANATIYANDQAVGTTTTDGTVTFTIDATTTDELELEIVKGAFEAEMGYEIQDGSLILTEEEHEGDGDKAEDEEDEEDQEDAEEEEDEEDEETDEEDKEDEEDEETDEEEDEEDEEDAEDEQ